MKIAVIGQGYVGLPLAKAAANAGHTVIGFDNNEAVIKQLLLSEVSTANYTPTLDPKTITGCDIYIIAVPTPLDSNNKPDLSYLKSAAKQVGEVAKDGALIINESTSYPGTLREVVEATISSINKSKLLYAAAPERIDPANTKWSIKNTPRVVAGLSDEATTATLNFYKSFCDQVVAVSSAEVAEAAKLFENTFRQVNIALVNEFAQIAEKFGISANEVIDAAATKPFGFMKFTPGLGVGGHCIPIDPIYLEQKAESLGATASFIKQATAVNQQMPLYVVQRLEKILGNVLKKKFDGGPEASRLRLATTDSKLVDRTLPATSKDEPAVQGTVVVKEGKISEKEIKSDAEFAEYATELLKSAHGDKFDEAKAKEVIDGLTSKYKGDYGAMVGALQSTMG